MDFDHEQSYYGAFLNLKDRLCVVVGGGKVARRKVERLIDCGSQVLVISPELDKGIRGFVDEGRVTYMARKYQEGDLSDAFLVFAATNSRHINQLVYEEATRRGKLVNVIDHPKSCSFIVPASYRQDELQIAISTSGKSPQHAKLLRELLEKDLEYGTHHFMDRLRERHGRS